jgi:hypothetical protein
VRYFLSSIALLVPCFWLPRIEAGDLSSHVYNAWLASLIGEGRAPGLWIQPQWTNVLFDLQLSALWGLGPALASKIAVAMLVLIFAWGAFALARVSAGREPWFLLPVLAMASYGWVFHMGLFNFYLSLGLSLWAVAIGWHPRNWARIAGAAALLALAYTAHAIPVAWAVCFLGYRVASLRLRPRYRWVPAVASVLGLVLLRGFLRSHFPTGWWIEQAQYATGSDQIAIYGGKYQLAQLGLLGIWAILLVRAIQCRGWRRIVLSVPLHVALLTAVAIAIIPTAILLPGYAHRVVYIAERMSLAVAVCVCVLCAPARPKLPELALMTATACFFFGFMYMDDRALNGIEARLERAVKQVPPGARVVATLAQAEYRVDPLIHMIDRACVGHCFAYGNYEPPSRAFRIRAAEGNPIVVSTDADSCDLQTGRYNVKERDLPLWAVFPQGEDFAVRQLKVAESWQMVRLLEK